MKVDTKQAIGILTSGGIGVMPTDTIYGIVGQALNQNAVSRVEDVKNRSDNKPFIVLISSFEDLNRLKIDIDNKTKAFLLTIWPGPVSVILPCKDESLAYLHHGMDLAVRWPDNENITNIIKVSGPLVAPSANPEGMKPSSNVSEANEYFGNNVDFYLDGGLLEGEPSTLVSLIDGEVKVLREGKVKI